MPQHSVFAIALLLWAGMILGISCLEAWVKFKAPSLTKAVGLDVGRTVFRAFHHVQWLLLLLLLLGLLFQAAATSSVIVPLGLGILLALQTFWLFPYLNQQVELILAGSKPAKSYYHAVYAFLELGKLFLLLGSAVCFLAG